MSASSATTPSAGLVVREAALNTHTTSAPSAASTPAVTATAAAGAAKVGFFSSHAFRIATGVILSTLALGVGLGVGLKPSSDGTNPAARTPANLHYVIPPTFALSALPPNNLLSSPPSGYTGLCPISLMSGDVSTSTATLHTMVLDPLTCGGGSVNVSTATLLVLDISSVSGYNTSTSTPLSFSDYPPGVDFRTLPGGYMATTHITNLLADTTYEVSVSFPGGLFGSRIGRFHTLPGSNYTGSIRFLHMSCANKPPYPIAPAVAHEVGVLNASFLIFNGDTVYADRFWLTGAAAQPQATIEAFRSLYKDQRNDAYAGAGFPFALSSAATFSGWDDHEVINDYSGGDPNASAQILRLKPLGYQAYFESTPITPSSVLDAQDPATAIPALTNPSSRIFRKYRPSAHVEIFQLDLRQYRDAEAVTASASPLLPMGVSAARLRVEFPIVGGLLTDPDPVRDTIPLNAPNRGILGNVQREWLYSSLRSSNATWKVVVSEFMVTKWFLSPNDRWEGFPAERDALLSLIQDEGIENVVFLTGDVHASFFARVNPGRTPPIYEFTTGPVGQSSLGGTLGILGSVVTADLTRFMNTYASDAHVLGDGIRFASLSTPNYMSVDVNASSFTVTVRNGLGAVLEDLSGRAGVFSLPEDGVNMKGYLGVQVAAAGRRRRMLRHEREASESVASEGGVEGVEGEWNEELPHYEAEQVARSKAGTEVMLKAFRERGSLFKLRQKDVESLLM